MSGRLLRFFSFAIHLSPADSARFSFRRRTLNDAPRRNPCSVGDTSPPPAVGDVRSRRAATPSRRDKPGAAAAAGRRLTTTHVMSSE